MSPQEQTLEAPHGQSRTLAYLVVAAILAALTAMEVWVSYIHALRPILVPLLVVLSGAKFVLVVLFYMHLHYDSWAFTAIFVPGLLLAGSVVVILLGLMVRFFAGF
jgi:cytochrome c oxidase subunit IV